MIQRHSFTRLGATCLPLLLAACSMFHGSTRDPAADRVRTELSQLQADSRLSSRVPVAMKDAEEAVSAAEVPQKDPAFSNHQPRITTGSVFNEMIRFTNPGQ